MQCKDNLMATRVPHLLVYISGHGFGHVSQVAPVLNVLRAQHEVQLTVCSAVPESHLQSRIEGSFTHIGVAADVGMVMASALDVLPQQSMAAYLEFHHDWPGRLRQQAQDIAQLKPDFVLSNVAYLPLLAAHELAIPSAAMCSLNWLDIFSHYCGGLPGAQALIAQMFDAYAVAERFLRITPGMPMDNLENRYPIGPIARLGKNRRHEINALAGLGPDEKLVLISLGGIATRVPMEDWPQIPGVRWLVQRDWQVERADVLELEALQVHFTDALASCDALICKPGYGSFAEAACHAIPVLYVARDDWPEEPCLIEWLAQVGQCRRVEREQLESGQIATELLDLFKLPHKPAVEATGIGQAVDYLVSRLF